MKKQTTKKLTLSRETLAAISGRGTDDPALDPTVWTSDMMSSCAPYCHTGADATKY